jgi:hypothetical protein
MFQHMPGSLLAQLQQMCSSQTSKQSQYHTQANVFSSQQELNNWTKVLYKRRLQDKKESEHWLN